MRHTPEIKEPLKIFLDSNPEPIQVSQPPLRFQLPTIGLPDGPHVLRVVAPNGLAPPTVKEVPFFVRNGVAVSVSGLEPGQTYGGQIDLIVNAYAGSTELNFEPKRAETPQPIPTWAWVLLLAVGAWTFSYVLTPGTRRPGELPPQTPSTAMGARIYSDTCARCHGEDGKGQTPTVPPLRDATRALKPSPYELLAFVVTSAKGSMMPAWGTRLTNEELVSVVNTVRTSWRHDSSTIDLKHRSPPSGPVRPVPDEKGTLLENPDGSPREELRDIHWLEAEMLRALKGKIPDVLGQCCYPKGSQPILFRTDGIFAKGTEQVSKAWNDYFDALGKGEVLQLQLIDTRYSYDPEQFTGKEPDPGARVIAMGRVFLSTKNARKESETAKGRFIRVYEFFARNWTLIFDFADIPMNVGCGLNEEEPPCPPEEANAGKDKPVEPDGPIAPARANDLGYAEVKALLSALKAGKSAPHGAFWNDLEYADFLTATFPDVEEPSSTYRIVQPWNAKESNLYRALNDGRGCLLRKADGTLVRKDVERMPKGRKPMAPEDIERIGAWIDAGCPEFKDKPSTAPKEDVKFPPEGAPAPPTPSPAPPDPAPAPTPAPAPPGPMPPPTPPPGPAPAKPKVEGPVMGYADVQALLGSYLKSAPSAPHQDFWTLSYAEFIAFRFPRSEGEDGTIQLLVPGDSAKSNLIRALKDGKGILVTYADGRTEEVEIKRMPPRGKKKPTDDDLAKLAKWIDAGAPEQGW